MAPEPTASCSVRPLRAEDRDGLRAVLRERWGSETIVVGGLAHAADELPGFVAEHAGEPVGYLTLCDGDRVTEIVTLDALQRGVGVGSALVGAAVSATRERGQALLTVTTTNDNLDALRFYQRRGFRLAELRTGAVDAARALKPSIPQVGEHGIGVHDEIGLRFGLGDD